MDQLRCYGCMKFKDSHPVCEHCGFDENAANLPHQLPQGTVLQNQYILGRVLGQGGFGITYLGWDRNLERPVAIKEYFPQTLVGRESAHSTTVSITTDSASFTEGRERFLREARTLAKLQNVSEIARIHNFFSANNTAYIIMEFVDGITLQHYARGKGGRLSPEETLSLLRPVIQALSRVHQTGLIHRDISPDNIMLERSGSVRLLDFGTARPASNAVDGMATHSTQAVLKYGFAPLEQYQTRGNLGPWTDEYALCATAYYCMTGKIPPDATTRVLGEADVDWYSIPGLAPHQAAALDRGMALKIEQRFPSLEALGAALFAETVPTQTQLPYTAPLDSPPYTVPLEASRKPAETSSVPPVKTPKGASGFSAIAAAGVMLAIVVLVAAVLLVPGAREKRSSIPAETTNPAMQTTAPTQEAQFSFEYKGGTYVGCAEDGVPQGQGTWTRNEGVYEGNFRDGYPSGEGTFTYAAGSGISPVSGIWDYDSINIYYPMGVWENSYGGIYMGMLIDGQPWGLGKMSFEGGGSYVGTFHAGWPGGSGVYTYVNGASRNGTWTWAEYQSSLYESRDGSTLYYVGMICEDKANGFGGLTLEKCGTLYGEFFQGSPDGHGKYIYRSPMPVDQPTLVGNTWKMVSGSNRHDHTYYGLTLDGLWQGFGLGIKSNGSHYVGEIRDEYRQGYGRLYLSGNQLYQEGTFNQGMLMK